MADCDRRQRPVQPSGVFVDAGARDGEQNRDLVGGHQRLVQGHRDVWDAAAARDSPDSSSPRCTSPSGRGLSPTHILSGQGSGPLAGGTKPALSRLPIPPSSVNRLAVEASSIRSYRDGRARALLSVNRARVGNDAQRRHGKRKAAAVPDGTFTVQGCGAAKAGAATAADVVWHRQRPHPARDAARTFPRGDPHEKVAVRRDRA